MIAPTGAACDGCGAGLILGSGRLPYCPTCERAYHALEMRFEQTQVEATFDEVVQAMIEDASFSRQRQPGQFS